MNGDTYTKLFRMSQNSIASTLEMSSDHQAITTPLTLPTVLRPSLKVSIV